MKRSWLGLAGIGLLPLVAIASNTASEPFDSREATIDGVYNTLFSGITACRDVVSSFLSRIEAFNTAINSILSLDPNVLSTNPLQLGTYSAKIF
jgi:hypothetical protein